MSDKTETAYCILGANLGRRAEALRRATFLLGAAPGVALGRASRIYETPPWGLVDQPPFLNAAVEIHTSLGPTALLDLFKEIERRTGRSSAQNEERWGPRAIDLDLALYGSQTIDSERLTVPHPRLAERAFALVALLDAAPEVRWPATTEPCARTLERLSQAEREACHPIEPLIESAGTPGPAWPERPDARLWRSRATCETEALAEAFARGLAGGDVVALSGDLGAGKTCFARGLARGLGIAEPVTSPSYVLVRSYEGRLALHHADFYRLSAAGASAQAVEAPEIATLGLDDYLEDPEAVVLIEWADNCPHWLEPPFWLIEIAGCGTAQRLIHMRCETRADSGA